MDIMEKLSIQDVTTKDLPLPLSEVTMSLYLEDMQVSPGRVLEGL